MSYARIAAIVAAALMWWGGVANAAGPLRAFQAGFWSGGAYTDDRTGSFTHCSAGVAYDSGINMFILVTDAGRWWLGFVDRQWAFAPQAKMPVALRFDGGPRAAMIATIPNRQVVLVLLPDDERMIDRLRRSSELSLIADRQSYLFKLNGARAAMAGLQNCVQKSVALETRASAAPPQTLAATEPAIEPASALSPAHGPAPAETLSPAPATAEPMAAAPPRGTGGAPAAAPGNGTAAPGSAAAASTSPAPPMSTPLEPASSDPAVAPATPSATSAAGAAPAPAEAAPLAFTATPGGRFAALDVPRPPVGDDAPAFSLPRAAAALPPATPTDFEEVQLAQDFFTAAQLPNARIVVTDKPAALASFAAVWRSDNSAGAVKIIPPGPDVSGIGIASNLIAVDPLMCNGDFASARSSSHIDNGMVYSATLSCTEEDEERTARYFITPRPRGGFVVFAVVGTSRAGAVAAASARQSIDALAKAAVRAVGNGG
jgi:hypothetical protein